MATTFLWGDPRSGFDLDQYAGFSRLLRIQEHGVFGKCDVDAGLFHFRHRHHGALQLSFERATIIHMLRELGGSEIWLIEEFKPDLARLREAQSGHGEA